MLVLFINEVQNSLHVLPDLTRRGNKVTVHEGEYQRLAATRNEVSAKTVIIAEGSRFSEDIWLWTLIIVPDRSRFASDGKQLKKSIPGHLCVNLPPQRHNGAGCEQVV